MKSYPHTFPLEPFIYENLLLKRRSLLLVWGIVELAAFSFSFLFSLHYQWGLFARKYLPPIALGLIATNLDIYVLLGFSQLCREQIDGLCGLLSSDEKRQRSRLDFYRSIYGRRRLAIFAAITCAGGIFTFLRLGLNVPSLSLKIATYAAIVIIFILLGVLISVATAFLHWINKISKLEPRIIIFHPDRLGGLGAVSRLADWVVMGGSFLVPVYSLGAYYSPFSRIELKEYSYLWVVLATILLIAAFLIPAFSIHRCYRAAHEELSREVAQEYQILFESFVENRKLSKPHPHEIQNQLATLLWFSELVERINLWPYRRIFVRVIALSALQILPVFVDRLIPRH